VDHFDKIQEENDNFVWHLALSDVVKEDDWENPESPSRQPKGAKHGYAGFIHNVLFENYLKNHPAPEDCEYYMCGPPMMNKAVISMLEDLGVPSENIALDDFGG
jgi:Na+-transporting NADH:ubiquinone oxidoreductase subunit F